VLLQVHEGTFGITGVVFYVDLMLYQHCQRT